ncbi:MAG: hypothetical protein GY847_26965 [Proteobacteria bacterium]|nr:hypothetical protein [Pseudomonadota bacterium]
MKRKLILSTTVLAITLIIHGWTSVSSAQEIKSTEDEDEAFLSESTEPAGQKAAETPKDGETSEEGEERARDHFFQGFANVFIGTGFFMVAPYDKDDEDKMCKKASDEEGGEPVCTGRSGFHLDMLGGFGVLPGLEVFAIFRLGLEQPSSSGLTNQPKVRQIGAGIKIYTPKDGLFKIGFGVAPLFDFSNHGGGADIGYDFIIHVPIQAQFDINPWFGAYVQLSPNISFISEFRLEFTGGIGVQGRFP